MSTIRLGSRSTPEQALRGASLFGKRAIVTGASDAIIFWMFGLPRWVKYQEGG